MTSLAVFDDPAFIRDLNTFKAKVLGTNGCLSVQITRERDPLGVRFFFISTWKSYELWEPHFGPKYLKRMSDFHKKYLASFKAYVTEDYIP